MRGMIVFAVALAGASSAAMAQSNEGRCFDKGTLTYYDCPKPAAAQPTQVYAPAPAVAPMIDDSGFYIGARGGLAFADEIDYTAAGVTSEASFDMGYALGGLIGYDFGEVSPGVGLRTDLEVGYQAAEVDSVTVGGVGAAGGGSGDVIYGFANVYGDIGLLRDLDLILGAGAGLGQVKVDGISANGVTTLDDDDVTFGYHLDAGLGYALAPNVTVEAMYRYSSFIDAEMSTGGTTDKIDVSSHQALLGLRFGL